MSVRIFVADDDEPIRKLIRIALEDDGYEVIEVADGRSLLEEIDRALGEGRPPDAVLCDHHMPGASGLDVLFELDRRGRRVPFVLMSALLDPHTVELAAGLGAWTLEKPFDLAHLGDLMGSVARDDRPRVARARPRSRLDDRRTRARGA